MVTGDYACMLHLDAIEESIQHEEAKNQNAEIYNLSLGATRRAWFTSCECLNAIYFLMYAACFTGRNNVFLHDFTELNIWSCDRFVYSKRGKALRVQHIARPTEQQLRRLRLAKVRKNFQVRPIEHSIFKDTAYYWSVVYQQDMVATTAIGCKVLSEHRLQNYRASVALGWFEVERWLYLHAEGIGISTTFQTRNGRTKKYTVSRLIDKFPDGTWVHSNAAALHRVRDLRNSVAHAGYTPSLSESADAIDLFIAVFNFRSGLSLRVDTNRSPTFGLS